MTTFGSPLEYLQMPYVDPELGGPDEDQQWSTWACPITATSYAPFSERPCPECWALLTMQPQSLSSTSKLLTCPEWGSNNLFPFVLGGRCQKTEGAQENKVRKQNATQRPTAPLDQPRHECELCASLLSLGGSSKCLVGFVGLTSIEEQLISHGFP